MGNVLLTAKALAHRPARFYRETHRSCEGWVSGFSFDFQDLVLKPVAKSAAP